MVNINEDSGIEQQHQQDLTQDKIGQAHGHSHNADDSGIINHPGHNELHRMITLGVILVMVVSQFLLLIWRNKYPRSFLRLSLLGLWVFPIVFSLYYQHVRMILIWSAFSGALVYLYRLSTQNPLDRKTPKIVFIWFYFIYIISFIISVIGFLGMIFLPGSTDGYATIIFYGLYFGLLGRDFAELCSDRIATILGLGGSRLPFTAISNSYCAICTNNLKPIASSTSNSVGSDLLLSSINNSSNAANNSSRDKSIETKMDWVMNKLFSKKPVELPGCKHVFHEWCIRGWSLVGKKNMCPHCNEKVNLRELSDNPWEKQTFIWGSLLDSVRYLVVWNPIILYLIQWLVYLFDRDSFMI
ncbi:hypothetical protein DLAC_05544 [Tieghemostelium lacteum]|uniref:RING-type domain-containing protein n=1 Tax=Tieghemostelium lacteum TaxID=361077 RepID=A0A151ZG93_TIELA|nr:hypothetical protein DLAC_05544 [Tieghemostelium lacteum]|eukprot:KYQ92945.1 hypothetical protein DLAC_05544 [Tieghemostelium lacteum]